MPIVDGKTLIGWGVVRERPWHFFGLFATEVEATSTAIDLGSEYTVHYGESANTQHFVWSKVSTVGLG